jgi:iron complex outermembrane receptor protein
MPRYQEKWPFLLYYLLLSTTILAQSPEKIILLDEYSALPIHGVTFTYGEQQGISDEQGVISFQFPTEGIMVLSHINYGSWKWDEEALKELIREKIAYRKSIAYQLYPATVIAVHPSRLTAENIEIEYLDRMEHDGAAILSQEVAINTIRKSGNYGFDPVFRGFKYDQLNIVLNGAQSATAACPNRMDPPTSQMAPNMMDRIEILKGPHALRYGTGVGGTINFIPSKLRFTEERDLYGRISSAYLSNGNILRSESQVGMSNDRIDLSLYGAWSQGNDYKDGNGRTVQADFQRGSFGANLGVRLSHNQQLRFSALYNLARDADFPALPMDLRKDGTWLFNASHEIHFHSGSLKTWNTSLFGSFVEHRMDNLLKTVTPRTLNAETEATTFNAGARTEGNWVFSRGQLFTGADLRVEGAEGIRVREFLMGPNAGKIFTDNAWQKGRISKTGLFFEYQLTTDLLQYIFSGRVELNSADIKDPSEEFTRVNEKTGSIQLNPNMSLGVVKGIGDGVKTGVWIGRAQRSGSLTERYINYFPVGQDPYEMLGNPSLHPEVNNQLDLTFEWSTNSASLDIDLFASYLQQYISSVIDTSLTPRLPSSPGVRQYVNIDDVFKTGFEVNWSQQLPLNLQHHLGIAYTYAQDLDRKDPLPEVAPFDLRYTLKGSYLDHKLRPEVTFRYVMEQSRISEEFGETVTPSFTLVDLKLSFQPTHMLRLSAGVNNLLDAAYYEHLSRSVRGTSDPIYAPGRCFMGSVNISF